MALVADAVNHLFYPSRKPTNLTDPSHRSQAPVGRSVPSTPQAEQSQGSPQSQVLMSDNSGRDTAVPATRSARHEEQGSSSHIGQSLSQQRQPPSPPLVGEVRATLQDPPNNIDESAGDEGILVDSPKTSSEPSSTETDGSRTCSPQRIKVRDLAHIQAIAGRDGDQNRNDGQAPKRAGSDNSPQYEISGMPIENIIEMVAGLLTKITTTNDVQHEHLHRGTPHPENHPSISPQTTSVLAFHGKNVPSITILSYLNRINKYCPTSYEVFISLLVYFDRMTEKVNAGPIQSLREANQQAHANSNAHERSHSYASNTSTEGTKQTGPVQMATPPLSGDLAQQRQPGAVPGTPHSRPHQLESPPQSGIDSELNLSHFFVVDSFNIHRLVIAGVTCASKFFSDIFYTNSRYAKVGGLPLPELNHLELQFLLLNDFRLSVPVEELEAYGTMLVEFYAREVFAQQEPADALAPAQTAG